MRRARGLISVLAIGYAAQTIGMAQNLERHATTARSLLRFADAARAYVIDFGELPRTSSLRALYDGGEDFTGLRGYLPDWTGRDGWNRELSYERTEVCGECYRVRSTGEDGRPDTDDDIVLVDGEIAVLPSAIAWVDILGEKGGIHESERRMTIVQVHLQRRSEEKGKMPGSLSDVVLPGELHRDAWGSAWEYAVLPDGYSLLSRGPDRLRGTTDDIATTWRSLGGPDERTTQERLAAVETAVRRYRAAHSNLPGSLAELVPAMVPEEYLTDAWGSALYFDSAEVGSAGKDRRPRTPDDIVIPLGR